MVYNPPVLKEADGEEPVVVTVNPARSGDAYIEQAKRAAAWIGLLVICWLLQRLWCHFGLPPNCDLPKDALEVLTDLLALMVFGLTQVRRSRGRQVAAFENFLQAKDPETTPSDVWHSGRPRSMFGGRRPITSHRASSFAVPARRRKRRCWLTGVQGIHVFTSSLSVSLSLSS